MKSELIAKYVQHLNRKHRDRGFTSIELLVVILIIGIFGAIAIPNVLNQTVKAKQTEAKQNIGMVNRAQNNHRAENNNFANNFDVLAIGSIVGGSTGTTTNYTYALTGNTDIATVTATVRDTSLKAYSGATVRYSNSANMSIISATICETKVLGNNPALPNTPVGAAPTCQATETPVGI